MEVVMKKSFQRAAAMLGVVFLAGMYILTLAAALLDHSAGQAWLKASITATFLVPVLLYAILLVERGLRERKDSDQKKKEKESL